MRIKKFHLNFIHPRAVSPNSPNTKTTSQQSTKLSRPRKLSNLAVHIFLSLRSHFLKVNTGVKDAK
ncbi:MAG: hypothetical protein ACKO96_19565, partial [Flammeovirgaceae bacterium]